MTCSNCNREHTVTWPYTIRVVGRAGTTVVERQFCNHCELAWLRQCEANQQEPVVRLADIPSAPKRKRAESLPFTIQLEQAD